MNNNWLMFFFTVWLLLNVICGIAVGTLTDPNIPTRIQQLMSVPSLNPISFYNYASNIAGMLSFDYPEIFTGWVAVFRLLFAAISACLILNILVVVRGSSNS